MKNLLKSIAFLLLVSFFTGCVEKSNSPSVSDRTLDKRITKKVSSHFDLKVAEVKGESIVFVEQISEMIENMANVISPYQNPVYQENLKFGDYKVVKEDSLYFLMAESKFFPASTKVLLVLDGGQLYECKYESDSSRLEIGYSCTCEPTGEDALECCQPMYNEGEWYCSDCPDGDCEKRVTAREGGMLYL